MPTLHLLGTGAAYSDGARTTTMLAFEADDSLIVVDCGGDVVQRLLAHGLAPERIDALFITHEHPDHVGGFPLFMERLWLSGRRRSLDVYGPESALSQARRCFETFDTSGWEGLPEIHWHPVPLRENAPVLKDDRWRVTASPGVHSVPVMGLRAEHRPGGGTVAYSCDTEATDSITRLARGADILLHEAATEPMPNHSTVAEAAAVAREANVGRLVLVHLPPGAREADLKAGREIFPDVELGKDGARYRF